jgi:two-component system sensor histidine kinase CpxA
MHRLFWKFFLSFWIALIFFSGAIIFAVSHYLDELRDRENAGGEIEHMLFRAREAQAAADSNGIAGLRTWAHTVDKHEAIPILVLNQSGEDILGRTVPQRTLEHIRHDEKPAREPDSPGHSHHAIRLANGTEYSLHADFPGVTLARVLQRPRIIAVPVFLAALISGIVGLVLARYLVGPIEKLRRATEIYAAGDLSQRVGPSLGQRRDEIVDLAHSFDRMAEQLSTLMHSHKQLLTDVSHELRSPLARLQAAMGLARQRAGDTPHPEFDRIERETERLSELIGQLLSLARLESRAGAPKMELIDLSELLNTVASDARIEAQSQQRDVQLNKPAAAVLINANGPLLHSAIENVVRNALRYTAIGTSVELSLATNVTPLNCVCVRVRDHGPGIPENLLPRIFEPFVRVEEDRGRSSGGYGLGLAIAQRAVLIHGGEITALNETGGGLTVSIRLPCANIQQLKPA